AYYSLYLFLGNVFQNNPLLLLFSTTKDIRVVNSTTRGNNFKLKPIIVVKNYSYIAAIDFHFEKKKVFWVDHESEGVFGIDYDGVVAKNKVEIANGVFTPDGLTCDWFTNKIYWTDSETNRIEPRAIVVVPMKGFMFWTDWGEVPKIEKAGMNGDPNTRKVVVTENIFWPNGLAVDYEAEYVYWIDGKLKFICRMDYNGNNLKIVLERGFEYPFAVTQFQTKLFWTDWKTIDVQPKYAHPCEVGNGGCSHLCLLSPNPPGYTCACPIGIKLINEKICADEPQELLLLARRTEICLIYLDSPDYSYRVLPLSDVKYSIAVDFDPVENFIYWSDDEVKKIQRARLNGSDQQDVISTEIQDPDGIALDWVSRNIYWTDTGTDRIEVARLQGATEDIIKIVVQQYILNPIKQFSLNIVKIILKPNHFLHTTGIAVASDLGWLFWSDWNEKDPKVERSNLDGSERIQIVTERLGWPNGITLDLINFKIYWCDAKADKIEYANMDGTDRRELINDNVPHVFGFSLMGEYLYWTDWQRRAIDRAHKETGSGREIIVDQMENVMGLKAIKLGVTSGLNPCKENNGNCSQLCLYRHDQTRVCACQIDYELTRDKQNCVKPEAFLLFAKKDSIGRISMENENNEMTIPIPGIKQASAIDFDTNTMRIYWSDSKLRTIMRAFINGSDPQRVIDLGLASPEGIAVDWLGLNIYWTDPVAHRIEVSRLVGTSRRTLLWDEAYEPHSIVLDPAEGYVYVSLLKTGNTTFYSYMYWSEWGTTNSIKKATMEGTNQVKLISTVRPATSLTLDYETKRLYWAEKDTPAIMSLDLDGNDQREVIKEHIFEPVGLTLYKEYIYWTDNKTAQISRANKYDGSDYMRIHSKLEGITDLLVYHYLKQKQSNQCVTSNGGCSHLCLALPAENPEEHTSYTCACPTHYTLHNNECIPPSNFMIYSLRNLVVRLVPDTSDCPEAVLPIQGLKAVKAIDFDPKSNFLYWIDGKSHSIKRSEASGQPFNVVVPSNPEISPYDLAVDAIGRLLFWTCALKDVINVTRLDNSSPFGSLEHREGEKPRLIALHAAKRLIFYTDVGSTPQLVRTRLDGSHRIVITKAGDIAAIAVDTENDLIVWAQGHSIYISNIDGENQHVLLNESNSKIIQLTVHSGWLYWIDKELHQLQRLELISGKSRSTLPIQASHILDLISVKTPENHSCNLPHQRKCSHFCILNGTAPHCSCPNGKMLQEDKRTCQILPDCGNDRFTCSVAGGELRDCIPIAWRCDRQKDCTDGSDELDCPKCMPNQFRCQDGQCINKENYCDSIPHCADRSDEKNCCENGFQCPQTEVCLPLTLVCDGNENCADGSDEKDCNAARTSKKSVTHTVILSVFLPRENTNDQSEDSLSPMHPNASKNSKFRKGIPDVVRMSMMSDSGCPSTFDRRHVTGASSSSNTNGSSIPCYPRETLNPPPSPATTAASTRGSSPSSRYRPYRHYRVINQPPPPTPCSTDICDESDYNYPLRSRYDGGPFPPPPTPRSHCHQESCPPSPSSRSSTYFSPLPPPPSPVASPRAGYDS
ncbi:hypothetical protein NQ317_013812, partial [Molorchus minor]